MKWIQIRIRIQRHVFGPVPGLYTLAVDFDIFDDQFIYLTNII